MTRTHFLRNLVILVSILFLNITYSSYIKADEKVSHKKTKNTFTKIISNPSGTVFLKSNGTAIVKYNKYSVKIEGFIKVKKDQLKNIVDVYATNDAFAALKEDGSVISWGFKQCGGDPNYSDKDVVKAKGKLKNVKTIVSSSLANVFVALKNDGTIVSWGIKTQGANPNYEDENTARANGKLNKIVKVVSTINGAFAALKEDGTVVSWGNKKEGGDPSYSNKKDGVMAARMDLTDIEAIDSNDGAFIAFKNNGARVIWGYRDSIVSLLAKYPSSRF